MTEAPGQIPGQGEGSPPGYTWADYIAQLVTEQGSLASLALALASLAPTPEDPASIERALRRLRKRGHLDGGALGRRLLRAFGLPASVEARLRWMGAYHSRFTDLPRSLCLDQLRLWDRPPVSESRARVWIELGLASVALRGRERDVAEVHLRRAKAASGHDAAARAEVGLCEAFMANKAEAREQVEAKLAEVGRTLEQFELPASERACLHARWIDQRAFLANNPPPGQQPDPAAALALYRLIPSEGTEPFVSYRRDAGMAYARWKLGERGEAIALAKAAVEHAGDGGFVRLRSMGLHLLSRILGDAEGAAARERALAIARRLEDEELAWRIERRSRAD